MAEPYVIVRLGDGEENVGPVDAVLPLLLHREVVVWYSIVASEIQVVEPAGIQDDFCHPDVGIHRVGEIGCHESSGVIVPLHVMPFEAGM